MSFFINVRDYIYYNRKNIIIAFIAIISIIIFFIYNNTKTFDEENIIEYKEEIEQDTLDNIEQENNSKEETEELYIVDIKGMVKNPGTYELSKAKRVIDVINIAGGLTEKADVSSINLSQKIFDEMMIIIPSKSESENVVNNNVVNNSASNNISYQTNNNNNSIVNNQNAKISINTADLSLLMTIKGIGEVKAKAIIEYRNKNGLFKKIEDITKVKGIGNSTFEKIKDYIKV